MALLRPVLRPVMREVLTHIFGMGGGEIPVTPTDLALTEVDDYIKVDFTNNSTGSVLHEIWSEIDGLGYELLTVLATGLDTYNAYDKMNATLNYKVRAKAGSNYSDYSTVEQITAPFLFMTDQTVLNQAKFTNLNLGAVDTINVDWGDETNADYSGNNANVTHDYGVEGIYYVKITGDVNTVSQIYLYGWTSVNVDISRYVVPTALIYFYWRGLNIVGNPSNFLEHGIMQYFYCPDSGLSGDLSGVELPSNIREVHLNDNKNITDLPRGLLKTLAAFKFDDCNVNTEKIESWLSYANTYFSSNAPVRNCVYWLSKSRMGRVLATNTDLTDIVAIYVGDSKTCTILTYDPVVAWSDRTSKVIIPLTTPDGFDETIHPSPIDVGSGLWNGYRYWLADTPYHNQEGQYEKPCIWASNDGLTWVVPTGVTNPVIDSIHADTDLYYDSGTETMYLYYNSGSVIKMQSSTDAATWGNEVTVNDATGDTQCVSPAIIYDGSNFYMYYVDNSGTSTRTIKRKICSTINGSYITPQTIVLAYATTRWWHLDVIEISGVYWMAVSVGSGEKMYIARSVDGVNFVKDSEGPAIVANLLTETMLYKPGIMYIGAQAVVYYSCSYQSLLTIIRINVTLIPA